jgi:hypothetical protein
MNRTILAVSSKLTMQLNALHQKIEGINKQRQALSEECNNTHQNINNSSALPSLILPEQEVIRLRYLMTNQHSLNVLESKMQFLLAETTSLKSKHLQIKTQLKRLTTYQEKQQQFMNDQTRIKTEKFLDDWVNHQRGGV